MVKLENMPFSGDPAETATPAAVDIDVKMEDEALAAGWNFPSNWYTAKEIFALERRVIFHRSWQYLAPRSSLSRPGDIIIGNVGDVPVLVLRDEEMILRGFINACRHRGHPVVRENGNRRTLVCGYHAWSYRLDGRLRRAPGTELDHAFDCQEVALVPFSVACWGEAIFGNLDQNAQSFSISQSEIDDGARENGVDKEFSEYTFHKRLTYEVGANWKIFYDNDIECYHCPTIHPKSFSEAYVTNAGEFQRYESASGQVMGHRFPPRAVSRTRTGELPLRSENYRSIRAFPGFTVAQQDDIALLTQIIPIEVEKVLYICDLYAERGVEPQRIGRWAALWDQTFREDVEVCELLQRSFRTGALGRNRLVPAREPGVVWVRDNIWKLLRAALVSE